MPNLTERLFGPRLRRSSPPASAEARVRQPLRLKITIPYILLALLLILGAAYLVSQLLFDTVEERFANQLIDAGHLVTDGLARQEARLLQSLRLIANLEGIAARAAADDAEGVRQLILPVAVNAGLEVVDILSPDGTSLVSLHRRPDEPAGSYGFSRGDTTFRSWPFVAHVLAGDVDPFGDKYAGLVEAPWGSYLYIAGPIHDRAGRLVGAALVAVSIDSLTRELRDEAQAHVAIYSLEGRPWQSTFFAATESDFAVPPAAAADLRASAGARTLLRELTVNGRGYREIVTPLEIRNREPVGLIGAALPPAFYVVARPVTRLQVSLSVALSFVLIVAVGLLLARRITAPLLTMVRASAAVAEGNLDVEVPVVGHDEITVLADGFNRMTARLREGVIYRDLLGRSVSPEVREQLRQNFTTGELRLDGQTVLATVLFADIRGFTDLSERANPALVMQWLNDYFQEVVPPITRHGGVVNKLDGDAVMAFFGVLPAPLPAADSAYQACRAAAEMLEGVERVNRRRAQHSQPEIMTGIGIHTGPLVAGGLGTPDRMHYTIIGDTVNTAQRIETVTRETGATNILVSRQTLEALGGRQHEFLVTPIGPRAVKGRREHVFLYRLFPGPRADGRAPAA